MTIRRAIVGQCHQLARVTLWARARQLADGTFEEDGTAGFPPHDSGIARVLGGIHEEHVPCLIEGQLYWVPLDALGRRLGATGHETTKQRRDLVSTASPRAVTR